MFCKENVWIFGAWEKALTSNENRGDPGLIDQQKENNRRKCHGVVLRMANID